MYAGVDMDDKDWVIDAAGVLPAARQFPSPNCDARPQGSCIQLVVIHSISLPPGCFGGHAIDELFTNCLDPDADPYFREIAGLQVSAHFLIRRDGELIQYVPCLERAWHAGASRWRSHERCNDFSIGIELEGSEDLPFEEEQYRVLERLTRALREAYPITDCVGHCDIALPPGRKTDPGPYFEWARLAAPQGTARRKV